jgi:hypothetical protein
VVVGLDEGLRIIDVVVAASAELPPLPAFTESSKTTPTNQATSPPLAIPAQVWRLGLLLERPVLSGEEPLRQNLNPGSERSQKTGSPLPSNAVEWHVAHHFLANSSRPTAVVTYADVPGIIIFCRPFSGFQNFQAFHSEMHAVQIDGFQHPVRQRYVQMRGAQVGFGGRDT